MHRDFSVEATFTNCSIDLNDEELLAINEFLLDRYHVLYAFRSLDLVPDFDRVLFEHFLLDDKRLLGFDRRQIKRDLLDVLHVERSVLVEGLNKFNVLIGELV